MELGEMTWGESVDQEEKRAKHRAQSSAIFRG